MKRANKSGLVKIFATILILFLLIVGVVLITARERTFTREYNEINEEFLITPTP